MPPWIQGLEALASMEKSVTTSANTVFALAHKCV